MAKPAREATDRLVPQRSVAAKEASMTESTSQASMAAGLAKIQRLQDRQDILDCLVQIGRGADRFDRSLFVGGFHPDAQIEAGGHVGGPEDVYEGGRAMHESGMASHLHCHSSHTCELDGDQAHTETYYIYTATNLDGGVWAAAGRYIDRFERRAGAWKIAFRLIAVEWSGNLLENPAMAFGTPADPVNGAPSRSRKDPSYRRPFVNLR
jgi:hypothetical protein